MLRSAAERFITLADWSDDSAGRARPRRYTKLGYSGNVEPTFNFPTAIAAADDGGGGDLGPRGRDGIQDLDFFVGNEVCLTRFPCFFR